MAEEKTTTPEEKPKMTTRTIIIRVIIGIGLLIGAYFGGKKIFYELHHETTDDAQIEAHLIPILPRVSGYIKKLYVEDYAVVKKDSLLAEIDDADLQLQLQEMEADLAQAETDVTNARASIENQQASISASKANLEVAQARLDKAQTDFKRDQGLFNDGAITKKQLDDTRSALDVANKQFTYAKNDVAVAQSKIAVLNSQLSRAQAQIAVRQAEIDQQKLKISYCKIYATSDGKIGKRNVDVGQYVQAGTPLFTIVDDSNYWAVANYKETQLEHLKVGAPVHIKLDAYPDKDIMGKIVSFSDATGAKFSLLPPDNATGNFVKVTQRVPVKITIDDEQKYKDILTAGMNIEASVAY